MGRAAYSLDFFWVGFGIRKVEGRGREGDDDDEDQEEE